MPGPLEGTVVVDASWGMPGQVGTALLADYGARVIKVERPGATGLPQHRAVFDRSKWSIVLDAGDPGDRRQIRELIARADVFVESFGAGRAERYGLGHEELRAADPDLIVCSITGYGRHGPWRDRPGYDALVAARLGLHHEVDGPEPGPHFHGHPAIAYATGFLAAIGTLAAIRARRITGAGQLVDVSLLDGALVQTPMTWWWSERGLSFIRRDASGAAGFGNSRIITDSFLCSDGEYVMMHSGGEGGFKRSMEILGLGDRVRTIEGQPEMSVPLDDDETEVARVLAPRVFATRTRAEWIERFAAADLAVKPVLRPAEVLDDDQVRHAGMTVEVEDPVLGRMRQTSPVIVFAESPAPRPVPAPLPDANRSDVESVRSAWRDRSAAQRPSGELSGALDGVRVLDLSSFFATGYGAKLLSDLGADVIKIEQPAGDQLRPFPDPFEACNRGKRSLAIDLRTPAGLGVLRRLVATSDVVMHNLRPGKAEKLGVGYEQLAAVNPDLVYAYLPGFGSSGPRRDEKSFEPLLSGFTGVLYQAAGEGRPPIRKAFGNADYYNGLLGATAVLLALEHRARTGVAQYVESPHLHSSLFVMSENVTTADGTPLRPDLVLDEHQRGWAPTYRLYRTADGWICLAAVGSGSIGRLRATFGCDASIGAADLGAVLEREIAGMSTAEATARLEAAGVACEAVAPTSYLPELFFEPWALESERVFAQEHPAHGPIREVGLVTHLGGTPGRNRGPNALLGAHTRQILGELGCSATEIDDLVATGVCLDAGGLE
ncbi:CaiB/BaiF CoA transferase family protein [Desertimonas flava]|jgi:crotonobetainyl-CoA:carnitine CoA-transferase CaiB-like acyl-CoA transferase|uniref:CaiB/BaiF CoA transferase family protein n=1 Tax=Desertimonas flava TaxID=2064846 RepID=UPI000E34D2FE|nr:CoA transferase [Desertimonas flava]